MPPSGKRDGDWSAYPPPETRRFQSGIGGARQLPLLRQPGPEHTAAFEYNLYSGRSTQHIRIDGLANDFGIGAGIDVAKIARMEVRLGKRWQHDPETDGVYIDNVRLSNRPTEPYRGDHNGPQNADPPMAKPPGFLLPEFPGFEAGYHTFAIDPADISFSPGPTPAARATAERWN